MNITIYLITILIICLAFFIVFTRNSISSLLALVLIYVLFAILFLILGAEFLAILLIIVYVGAISILFLFVIMMLNLRIIEVRNIVYNYLPISLFIFIHFFLLIVYIIFNDISFISDNIMYGIYKFLNNPGVTYVNIVLLADLLYNHYYYLLFFCADILLLALIGSISITVDFKYRNNKVDRHNNYVMRRLKV